MRLSDLLVSIVALVTLVPALVLVRPALARRLYGLELTRATPEVALVVRHRAAFFGITGLLLLASCALPSLRRGALVLSILSKLAFVVLAYRSGALRSVARIDVALLALLGTAAWLDEHAG